jgi:hypothetical protein
VGFFFIVGRIIMAGPSGSSVAKEKANNKGRTNAENGGSSSSGKFGGGSVNVDSKYVGTLSLITFVALTIAWLTGFLSRLFSVIRFESIIHEFDPW